MTQPAFALPAWFGPLAAVPIGVAATVADLLNACPLLLAVERLTSADLSSAVALPALAGHLAVYTTPIAVLVALGAWKGERTRSVMERIVSRLLSGTVRRSLPLATSLAASGAASGAVALLRTLATGREELGHQLFGHLDREARDDLGRRLVELEQIVTRLTPGLPGQA